MSGKMYGYKHNVFCEMYCYEHNVMSGKMYLSAKCNEWQNVFISEM